MTKSQLPHAVATCAAVVTTLVLFSSVVSLADKDKAALAAPASARTVSAANGTTAR